MIEWLYNLFGMAMLCNAWAFLVTSVTWFFLGLLK